MLIEADDIRPDPKKTEALNYLPLPCNVREIQSFPDIVNYLSRFSTQIANLTGSLRPLVKKGYVYKTEKHHEIAFKAITKDLSNDIILKYYDLARKLFLECDVSGVGVAFALFQNFVVDIQDDTDESLLTIEYLNKLLPMAYGSQTFTECDRRYTNIERELLAMVCVIENAIIICLEGTQLFFLTISQCQVSFLRT